MGLHTEWLHTASCSATVERAGVEIGEYAVSEQVAVVFAADSAVVIEGPADEVLGLFEQIVATLREQVWRVAASPDLSADADGPRP